MTMASAFRCGILLWMALLSGCAGYARLGDAGARAPMRVLWVGKSDANVLPDAWRDDSVVVRAVPPRSEWWMRRLVVDGFRPDAVVFSGMAVEDSAARGAWGMMAARRMARTPAFYVHAMDPVDGAARRAWLERTDSAGDPWNGGKCDRIRLYGEWERAGVLADPSRWRRLSETPAERLLPCAQGDVERQAEAALRLRKALPVAPRLDPSRPLRIVLDVGHFPRSDSAPIKGQGMVTPRGVDEFELNRKAAFALAAALRDSLGAGTIVYNADGLERTLRGRTLAARRLDADLFLSIHHDAVSSREASTWIWNGVERLYCDSVRGFSMHVHDSSVNFPQALALARSIGTSLRAGGRVANLHHALNGRELLDSADAIYRSDFGVLLSARMPAILIECGVALNRDEELVLDSDEGRAEFARLVASGARRWLEAGAPGGE